MTIQYSKTLIKHMQEVIETAGHKPGHINHAVFDQEGNLLGAWDQWPGGPICAHVPKRSFYWRRINGWWYRRTNGQLWSVKDARYHNNQPPKAAQTWLLLII